MQPVESNSQLKVAVIGMSGRFPAAPDIESFWRLLCEGREGIRDFDDAELLRHGALEEDLRHPKYVRAGAPLDDPELFDARLFGVTPRDAELMDPQHRVLLEVTFAALEDAGYGDSSHRPLTGVFVGSSMSHYAFQIHSHGQMRGPMGSLQALLGNGESHLATRISHKLDLRGPSLFVQTACSTSLTAVHLACRSLLSHECDMAIAGGSSITMSHPSGYIHMEGAMLSPDGRCRSFDADAGGTVIGNGAGAVILKRLADAVQDGDTIYAVVLGSAVNNDGAQKIGYTAPSVEGQATVIAEALSMAQVDSASVGFVEAHGTATIVGDPIEVSSLVQVYRGTPGSCWIGSVKSNMGHLLAAAGVCGFIKAVLAVSRGRIPPTVHFRKPNPHIDFASTPFRVADKLIDWPRGNAPRRAAVSSFGIGGTNAHVIIEEPPVLSPASSGSGPYLLPVSALSAKALRDNALALAAAVRTGPADLADIEFTLQNGRQPWPLRIAVLADSRQQAAEDLQRAAETDPPPGRGGRAVWLFPGQGSQRPGMFTRLLAREGEFRRRFSECAGVFAAETGSDLARLIAPGANLEVLTATQISQPALFAVEYALARQWQHWGLLPGILIGHSVGEYAAACLAGVFSPEDAMRIVVARGRLLQAQPTGAMLAVSLPVEAAVKLAGDGLALAAVNAAQRCVLSGPTDAIERLQLRLSAERVRVQRLRVSHAFHSPMMARAADQLREIIARVPIQPPRMPIVSTVTGTWLQDSQATDPDYWAQQVVQPVHYFHAVQTLRQEEVSVAIEVGPGAALVSAARSIVPDIPTFMSDPGPEGTDDSRHCLETLAHAWSAGASVEWQRLRAQAPRRRVSLPTYRFDRQRYWISAKPTAAEAPAESVRAQPTRAAHVADWFYLPSWRRTLPAAQLPDTPSGWLLFLDEAGLGGRVAERLRSLGHVVATAHAGHCYSQTDLYSWTVDPESAQDYDKLLQDVVRSGVELRYIAHLWGVGSESTHWPARTLCFDSLLFLAQTLGRRDSSSEVLLSIVSEGVHRIGGEPLLIPERALGIGPARVIGQEYPVLKSRHIDLIESEWRVPRAIDQLIAELADDAVAATERNRDQPGISAWRQGERWIQTFEKVVPPARVPPLVQGGLYLITGGLGGIGLVLAERLARECTPTLVLTSRGGLSDEAAEKIRRIEAAGARVRVAQLDITDAGAVARLVAELVAEFGRIQGVIHAAGAPGGGVIQLKRSEQAHAVLSPKLDGTRVLEQALAGVPVDFLVHCSSLSSVRGGFGQVDYCAANAFLDAHAQSGRLANVQQTLSINWGAWAETGMAVNAVQRHGFLPCPFWLRESQAGTPAGHPLLDRVLASSEAQRAVRVRLRPWQDWVLADHRLQGAPTVPGTAYLEILRAAWCTLYEEVPLEIANVEFRRALSATGAGTLELLVLVEEVGDHHLVRIVTRASGEEQSAGILLEHVRAEVRRLGREQAAHNFGRPDVSGQEVQLTQTLPESPLSFGPHWQLAGRAFNTAQGGSAEVQLPVEWASETQTLWLHPSLLDVALGVARQAVGISEVMLPFGYGRIRVYAPLQPRVICEMRLNTRSATLVSLDARVVSPEGDLLLEIERYQLRPIDITRNAVGAKDKMRDQATSALAGAILSHEGAEAFIRALGSGARQLIISPLDLDAVVAKWQSSGDSLVERVASADLPRPARRSANIAQELLPVGPVEERIAATWSDLLGHTQIARNQDFFALGGDSLLGIQLHARLQDLFGQRLTLASVFENPTISALAVLVGQPAEPGGRGEHHTEVPLTATSVASIDNLLQELEADE